HATLSAEWIAWIFDAGVVTAARRASDHDPDDDETENPHARTLSPRRRMYVAKLTAAMLDVVFATWLRRLDGVLYRHPFEGASARRYEAADRPAFGDLDDRLLDALAPVLATARVLLEVGCGPATFASRARTRHPAVDVIAIDPSRTFARTHPGLAV